MGKFTKFGGNTKELGLRPSATTKADHAYDALHEMARRAERDRDFGRAGEIREALGTIDKRAVEALQALTTKHGIPETPFIQAMQQPPAAVEPTMAVTAIPLPAHTPIQSDFIAAYRQLRDLSRHYSNAGQALALADARSAASRISGLVARRFTKFGGDIKRRIPRTSETTRADQTYGAIQGMLRQAEESHDAARADQIRQTLEDIRRYTTGQIDKLTRKYGALDTLSTQATRTTQATQAMLRSTATAGPPVTVASTTVPLPSQFDIPGPAYPIVAPLNPAYTESAGGLVHATVIPGPPPVSGLPGPSHSETTVAEAGGLGRGMARPACHRLRRHGRAAGFHREHRHARARRDLLVLAATGRPGAAHRSPFPSTPARTTPARPCNRLPSPPPRAAPPPFSIAALRSPPLRGWTTTSTSSAPCAPASSPRGSMRLGSSPRPASSPGPGSPTSSPRAGSPTDHRCID